MKIRKKNKLILEGTKNQNDGLWGVHLDNKPMFANVLIKKNTLKKFW